MYAIWSLTKKELRLLLRDPVALGLLIGMPILFTLVQGLLLGESFGQKPDDTLRISIVDEDQGKGLQGLPWSHWVLNDLKETPGIRIEVVPDREEAERLIRSHKRAAILVLKEDFSDRVNQCSFLDTPGSVNPFHREGVHLDPDDPKNTQQVNLGVTLLKDSTQLSAASIMEQVVQVCMLRVILPYMIGQAFERLSDPSFIELLGKEVKLPVPAKFQTPLAIMEGKNPLFASNLRDRMTLQEMLQFAAGEDKAKATEFRGKVGSGVQAALRQQFRKYNLTGKTWAALTKSQATDGPGAVVTEYVDRDGSGLLRRGAHRYQLLVPSFTVMFAFFLVLIVGWIFVTERRQGTLLRLRAAPLTRGQILLGKLIPCYLVSLGQGVFLLLAGKLLFGMSWGPEGWSLGHQAVLLLLVISCTSLAAMGLALLVAALARTEIQVALYGAVPVLVLALIGGCLLPREMMPEQTQKLSFLTPHGWALDAYRELLNATPNYVPNMGIVGMACGVLVAFGVGFLALAWGLLRLE